MLLESNQAALPWMGEGRIHIFSHGTLLLLQKSYL